MDWIKKNPAQFTLAIVAVLAIAATAFLFTKVSGFDSNFEGARGTSVSNAAVEKLDTKTLDEASKAIETPIKWETEKDAPKLFISELYVIHDGKLERPRGKFFHPPVPNEWLINHKLDLLSATVLNDDPDGDGFTTLEEWNGLDAVSHLDMTGVPVMGPDGKPLPDDSTDPTDARSHPPYHTKLELVRIVYVPFRLRFMSYDINPKKATDITVAINTIDRGGRTHFKTIGEDIPGTNFKIDSFKQKEAPGADGTTTDVSEVTIINKETGEKVVLPLKKEVDSPGLNHL